MPSSRQIILELPKKIKPLQSIAYAREAKRKATRAFSNPDSPPIIIYQMGKVGSAAVYKTLLDASLSNQVLHLHFLSQDLPEHRNRYKLAGIYPPPYHFYLGEAFRKLLNKHQSFPIKVISLVRDPIARMISDVFENPYFAGESIQTDTGSIDPRKAGKYISHKLGDPDTFKYIYEWFDKELKTVFGIDVFADPFPLETGHAVYSKAGVEALVIRLEDLSGKGSKALADFLCLGDQLILKESNVRTDSTEREAYHKVRESVSLSPSLCKEIYSSKFVKHFYNETMIDDFISKWTKGG